MTEGLGACWVCEVVRWAVDLAESNGALSTTEGLGTLNGTESLGALSTTESSGAGWVSEIVRWAINGTEGFGTLGTTESSGCLWVCEVVSGAINGTESFGALSTTESGGAGWSGEVVGRLCDGVDNEVSGVGKVGCTNGGWCFSNEDIVSWGGGGTWCGWGGLDGIELGEERCKEAVEVRVGLDINKITTRDVNDLLELNLSGNLRDIDGEWKVSVFDKRIKVTTGVNGIDDIMDELVLDSVVADLSLSMN